MLRTSGAPRLVRGGAFHGILFAALIAAACGGQAPSPQTPQGPGPEASAAPPGEPAPSASAAPSSSGTATTPEALPPAPVEMKPLVPSAMLDDLRGLGIDPKNLPPIEKLEPRTLRGVMKIMAKSLGVKCADCHQEGDFAAPTRRKKIAAHMWDEFAAKLAFSDGTPIFCDSCHQQRTTLLDRRDKKALSKWMDDTFVAKLEHKPTGAVECETCHVDMEMHLLAKWGQ